MGKTCSYFYPRRCEFSASLSETLQTLQREPRENKHSPFIRNNEYFHNSPAYQNWGSPPFGLTPIGVSQAQASIGACACAGTGAGTGETPFGAIWWVSNTISGISFRKYRSKVVCGSYTGK